MSANETAAEAERAVGRRKGVRAEARGRLTRRVRLGKGLMALLVLAISVLATGFFVFVANVEQEERPFTGHAEGVVALTGGAERIADAIDLLAHGRAERLLITGVNQSTTAGSIARLTPQYRSLFTCCIDLGYAASNTVGNATETRQWVSQHRIRSVIVVTSNYHMPRALVEMGHELPGVELLAHPVVTDRQRSGPWWTDATMVRLLAFEYVKYLAAVARTSVAIGQPSTAPEAVPAGHRT